MDIKVLHQVMSCLDSIPVKYWIDQGTLLGLYRDKKIIEWDRDFDISIIYESSAKVEKICKVLSKHFKIVYYNFVVNAIKVVLYNELGELSEKVDISFYFQKGKNLMKYWPDYKMTSRKDRLILDIIEYTINHPILPYIRKNPNLSESIETNNLKFAWHKVRKYVVCVSALLLSILHKGLQQRLGSVLLKSMPKLSLVTPDYYFLKDIQQLSIDENTYPIPNDTENYLQFKYGENWRIPRREWDCMKDDGALRKENK